MYTSAQYAIENLEEEDLRWASGDLPNRKPQRKWKDQEVIGCILFYRQI
jgi:hypothetical protein